MYADVFHVHGPVRTAIRIFCHAPSYTARRPRLIAPAGLPGGWPRLMPGGLAPAGLPGRLARGRTPRRHRMVVTAAAMADLTRSGGPHDGGVLADCPSCRTLRYFVDLERVSLTAVRCPLALNSPTFQLALAHPAKRGIGRTLDGQVLAVAPGAARALVMSALAAAGADHVLILAPLARARQSRAEGRGDARVG